MELCCGTKSVGKVFEHFGLRILSVDFDERWQPDVLADIAATPRDELVELIRAAVREKFGEDLPILAFWASPQCTEYSRALSTRPRDLAKADALVRACLRLFAEYPTVPWFMENPETGLLKTRALMEGRCYHSVSYCKYSAAADPCCPEGSACPLCQYRKRYMKPTAVWTNTTWQPKRAVCWSCKRCPFMGEGGRAHRESLDQGGSGWRAYAVPGRLTQEIAEHLLLASGRGCAQPFVGRLTEATRARIGVAPPAPLLLPPVPPPDLEGASTGGVVARVLLGVNPDAESATARERKRARALGRLE